MKSVAKDRQPAVTVFPMLMRSSSHDVVIMACANIGSDHYAGIVVYGGKAASASVGFWSEAWPIRSFAPYTGEVTLSN